MLGLPDSGRLGTRDPPAVLGERYRTQSQHFPFQSEPLVSPPQRGPLALWMSLLAGAWVTMKGGCLRAFCLCWCLNRNPELCSLRSLRASPQPSPSLGSRRVLPRWEVWVPLRVEPQGSWPLVCGPRGWR